jgi:hypothetical protein
VVWVLEKASFRKPLGKVLVKNSLNKTKPTKLS